VRERASDKLPDRQGPGAPALAMQFLIAKEHLAVLDLNDATGGDGHLEALGGEVLDGGLPLAHRLAVDMPVDRAELGRDFPQ
jgi:hypothetical protein